MRFAQRRLQLKRFLRLGESFHRPREIVIAIAQTDVGQGIIWLPFDRLPKVMQKADALAGEVGRAVIDLAEAATLIGHEGERFHAVVTDTDQRGARIQLCAPPVVARIKVDGLVPGEGLEVRLDAADPITRTVKFSVLA